MADHNHAFDEIAYFEYQEEVIRSGGFLVKSDYGRYIPGGISRMGPEESDVFRQAEEAARFALKKEDPNLKFVRIVNLTMEPSAGAMYYVTLEAKNSIDSAVNLYQTKVWRTISNVFKVQLFRPASQIN